MKTKLLFIASAIMMVACSNQETFDSNLQQPVQQQASNIRSFEEALQIAQSSIEMVDGQAQTRAVSPRRIALNDTKIYKLDAKTRSSSYMSDTLMYVFNFEDNQGFAVVSASKNTEGLLAVTERGTYDPEEKSDNEGFNIYMKLAADYVSKAMIRDLLDPIPLYKEVIINLASSQTGPYVTVQWGQTHPEGEFCPNGVAGCVNTATAQLMSYYEYPTSIFLDYPDLIINDSTLQLNWTNMKAHPTGYHSILSCPDDAAHHKIAHLLRQIGKMTLSQYNGNLNSGNASTGSSLVYAKGALRLLGYTVTERNYPIPTMIESPTYYANKLDSNYLCLMSGDNGNVGHAWVLDGYKYDLSRHYYYERDENLEWIITDIRDIETYLFHLNWGWYGDCNGYFLPKVFNTQSATTYDDTSIHNYNFDNTYLFTVEEVCL
jgi:hypothetical protein